MSASAPLLFAVVLLTALSVTAAPATFTVAPSGFDANPGTRERPFASLFRAREAVRELRTTGLPEGGVTVELRGGAYRIETTFELTEADSGEPGRPVVYTAAEGEVARLVGGPVIPPEAFAPVTDPEVLARLDPAARGEVLECDLAALGATGYDQPWPVTFRGYAGWPELFYDRQPMQLARWPNEGFAKVARVLDPGSKPRVNEKPDRPGTLEYEGDRPARWLTADEVYLNGYWCFKWFNECIRVASINPAERTITFAAPHVYGVGGPSGGFYFALGLLEELDAPGEYYLDRRTGKLYFWPPAPLGAQEIGLSLTDAPLVMLNNTTDVEFRRLTFEFGRGQAVVIRGGARNRLAGCTIRNFATDAVRIDGGVDNGVQSCDLYQLGGGGISLSGGDRATLTPCRNYADNNHIHHFGRLFRTHRDAINLNGVGCRASHNLIHDAPHHAMDFGGNDHLVELNEVHDVCTETDDAGAIYTGRDWTVRGTVIRWNWFHDVGGSLNVGNQAIYVDDNACGVSSIGNVIQRVYRAFLIGGGRDNVMDNNLILDCRIPMHIDNRGLSDWAGRKSENWVTLTTRLQAVPYQEEPWRSRFPELVNILDDAPELPLRNRVTRNIMWRCGPMHIAQEAREGGTIENNWETADDPGLVDATGGDLRLRDDAPAFARIRDLQPIPFEDIGPYRDEFRPLLPLRAPVLSHPGGAFVDELELTIRPDARAPEAELRYTLDGTEPSADSPLYTAPLRLTDTVTIKVAAFAGAGAQTERSPTATATFTVRRLGPEHGVALSELEPVEALAHGGVKRDANYAGQAQVSLGGRTYERSLLLHPETTADGGVSRVVYALSGGLQRATRFRATVGIDDAMGQRGSVTFAVDVFRDGRWERVFESGVIRGGQPPQEVDVDITGAEQIRLSCTDGGDNINADHAAWGAPLLQ